MRMLLLIPNQNISFDSSFCWNLKYGKICYIYLTKCNISVHAIENYASYMAYYMEKIIMINKYVIN
jgi:hypothetical protein